MVFVSHDRMFLRALGLLAAQAEFIAHLDGFAVAKMNFDEF